MGLESRIAVPLVSSETPAWRVPGQYAPFPSQPVVSGLQQDDESESIPVQLLSLGGGVVGSWLVGVPVLYALDRTAGDRRVKGDAGYSPTAHWGMLVSSGVGAATGVHLIRKGLGATTSMEGALVGAFLGTLPLVLGVDSPYLPYFSFTVGSLLQAVGGLLGSR